MGWFPPGAARTGSAERTYAGDRDAAIRSMDVARLAGVTRYVMVSCKGSRVDHP